MTAFRGSAATTERWRHFDFGVVDGVATVTFSRPDRLNALTFEAYADLRDLLAELPRRDDVGVLVITGTGRGFCSGGDVEGIIGALQAMDACATRARKLRRVIERAVATRLPLRGPSPSPVTSSG